jgi:hypothetical protein
MLEKDFEDIICKYPELIEEGLILIGRQLSLYGRRMDILFEDKFKRKLIIELKAGPIKDDHIGQILSYEGMLLSADDPTLRVMLVGTRVPPNIQRSLDHHGIAWKEITFSFLKDFLKNKGDESFNHLFEYDEPVIKKRIIEMHNEFPQQNSFEGMKYNIELIESLKSSENYKSFKDILPKKIDNETEAKEIIEKNIGHLNINDLKKVIELINYPHQYKMNGKINKGNWFGQLLNTPNTKYIIDEDEINKIKINQWFKLLSDNRFSAEERLDRLLLEPNKIKGLNVGFITLMLYLLDKTNYSIWLKVHHKGLNEFIYPKLEKYTGRSTQYLIFNNLSKEFAKKFNFEPTELDWVLWAASLTNP